MLHGGLLNGRGGGLLKHRSCVSTFHSVYKEMSTNILCQQTKTVKVA